VPPFVYLAAPVRPIEGETREGNLALAREYYLALCLTYPDHVFLAPWILNCEVFEETPENIAKGMERNLAVIYFLTDCVWLVGPRVSDGMRAEAEYAEKHSLRVRRVVAQRGYIQAPETWKNQ
jgi:hypothetical protein